MTPQEKAKELIDKYYVLQDQDAEWAMLNNARVCALIVADEFLNFMENLIITEGSIAFQYWQEVKQELEKEIQ